MNCHTFPQNRPDPFLLHVRTGVDYSVSSGMVVVRDGKAERVSTHTDVNPKPAGFTSWHPSGSIAAFSINDTVQYMHATGTEVREVYDRNSDLAIVNFQTGAVSTDPAIADPVRLETFPCWSPDGEFLYFCSAANVWEEIEATLLDDYKDVKYDLMRIHYDLATNSWGKPEVLLAAAETGQSIVQPRASPDGRFLLFCMCDHGAFPAFRAESDLYLMDVTNRSYRRLEANSHRSESWHTWSSNSRWIVFASRRDNGLVAWPYFCYVDEAGQDHKPFLLPQQDPRFYDTRLKTYNLPELITGPIAVSEQELALRRAHENPTDFDAVAGRFWRVPVGNGHSDDATRKRHGVSGSQLIETESPGPHRAQGSSEKQIDTYFLDGLAECGHGLNRTTLVSLQVCLRFVGLGKPAGCLVLLFGDRLHLADSIWLPFGFHSHSLPEHPRVKVKRTPGLDP